MFFNTQSVVFLSIILFANNTLAEASLKADPDFISSGLAWTVAGIPSAKVGDMISFDRFLVGGMFEARNEARFNQEILPNHNWRGTAIVEANVFSHAFSQTTLSLHASLSHESAHPTMGIRATTDKAYELIYDDVYRRMILNAVNMSACIGDTGLKSGFLIKADYHFIFLSKNTPELEGNKLGLGNGFSLGAEYNYKIGKRLGCYVSLYDRIILKSNETDEGLLHKGNGDSLVNVLATYPIINNVNTAVLKAGLRLPLGIVAREMDLYMRLLYGGIYGFVDSRDNRFETSIGAEIEF